ncbi:MAG: FAD-dependent oxidoreductase [Desulfobacula sp.]|uniref:FAD-dependent oxidoreductase n=1 Tax=Desulfobacula sp. TaxID=2593537 RepID=UPI0025C377DB|nr:FAD-dependent oxidoreductase [Desulfobacula sp.]MCD4721967.1 FAD-dependent oxidoreductase [Desulfobacula sp.]
MQKLKDNQHNKSNDRSVLVIGGGVGGIRAALDLAESRRNVILIDKSYSIGGLMTQLDRTFPTNNCDLCTVSPHLSENTRQIHLDLQPMTQLEELTGEAGNFKATLVTEPRYIDIDKCTACGECHKHFPKAVRFTPGLDPRAPTCMRYPQATPYAFSIDMEKVEDVEALQKVCKADAIIPDDTQKKVTIEAASIVLSVGAELFDPSVLDNFGSGQFENVVTGLEYERIMSASGPFQGDLVRVSDKKRPQKVAWIQCVGSRGINKADVPYCSGVCCMYALKEAIVTKERFAESIETTIFYMDMRTYGKDYELYLNRAKNDYGVRMIRCRPHSIVEDGKTKDLSITYALEEEALQKTEEFDMVVLSTGFRIPETTIDLAHRLGIELNLHNFAKTDHFNPVKTSKSGVYVCGVVESPKDIPETMVQASAAASMAASNLPAIMDVPESENSFIPERDVSEEELRIGVFICDCGVEIGGVVDVDKMVEFAGAGSGVVVSQAVGYGCSSDSMALIEASIKTNNLNRVVIGGCSPRTHETKFQDLLRRAGLNKYLVEIVNLRDQNTWAHMGQPEEALDKAFKLLGIGISGVRKSRPLMDQTLPMNQNALVVGGGVTGMTAARQLADQGIKVYLVERGPVLGGLAKSIRKTIQGDEVGPFINQLIDDVSAHENIQVLTRSIIVDHSGIPGRFKTGIQTGPRMNYMQLDHGVTILATGALPNRPDAYGLGTHDDILTQLDLDALIEDDPEKIKAMNQVVMIQCVGSREPDNPNCSRICCQAAIKNALRIKAIDPDIQIFILYRDIRTYGFQEDYYRQARNLDVNFIKFSIDKKPEVWVENDRVSVFVDDVILDRKIQFETDCLVLSTGMIADDETTEDLAMMFHLPRTSDHYFLEDHVKLRPVDMSVRGFFIAGTTHSPKTIQESITQAYAAAGRAQTLLAKKEINLGAAVAKVDSSKCAACLVCVRACPFSIPFINEDGYSQIDPAKCQGCGICAADCPAKAIQLLAYEDDQIMAKLDGLFGGLN